MHLPLRESVLSNPCTRKSGQQGRKNTKWSNWLTRPELSFPSFKVHGRRKEGEWKSTSRKSREELESSSVTNLLQIMSRSRSLPARTAPLINALDQLLLFLTLLFHANILSQNARRALVDRRRVMLIGKVLQARTFRLKRLARGDRMVIKFAEGKTRKTPITTPLQPEVSFKREKDCCLMIIGDYIFKIFTRNVWVVTLLRNNRKITWPVSNSLRWQLIADRNERPDRIQ